MGLFGRRKSRRESPDVLGPLRNVEKKQTSVKPKETTPKHENQSHGLFVGNMNPDIHTKIYTTDAGKNATELAIATDEYWPDGKFTGAVTTNAAMQSSSTMGSHLMNETANKTQAAMGTEGLLIPCIIEFTQEQPKGTSEEYQAAGGERPDVGGGSFPTFEQPNTKLMNWEGIPGTVPITSPTLNPFVHGHHVGTVLRGSSPQNLQPAKENSTYGAPLLGHVPDSAGAGQRPLGLRGPLIVTGWGYDTEDLPVPNAKLEANLKDDAPKSANFGMPYDSTANKLLEFMDSKEEVGRYTVDSIIEPKIHFLNHHLKRLDMWKSGPVDLRWDRERKVWVADGRNRVYLSKAAKCIMPQVGPDGKNSWNWGVGGTAATPGRQYLNPCPEANCPHSTYFPASNYYPDIEIYDPEDANWCGKCKITLEGKGKTPLANCDQFNTACVPFYDGIIVKSMGHITSGKVRTDCGDKYRRTGAGAGDRRVGNPCHSWGSSYQGVEEYLGERMDSSENPAPTYSQAAASVLHRKIFIENPLSQGLMVGDAFLSYDTGRRLTHTYQRRKDRGSCGSGGEVITVTETIPVHVILQAEFFGVEVIASVACQQGEMGACTRKIFAQGMATSIDCGPDDDYPETAIF